MLANTSRVSQRLTSSAEWVGRRDQIDFWSHGSAGKVAVLKTSLPFSAPCLQHTTLRSLSQLIKDSFRLFSRQSLAGRNSRAMLKP